MMVKTRKSSIATLGLIFTATIMTGCGTTQQKPLYVWDNYVNTSVSVAKNSEDPKVVEEHMSQLQKIIDDSHENGMRVAPGLYAEYGEFLYQHRNKIEAKKYFSLEKQTYPESATFVDRLTLKLYGETL